MKHSFATATLLCALPFAVDASCPIGTYEWVDNWGNKICKKFGSNRTTNIQGSTTRCPAGTHQWVDNWGNTVCKEFNSEKKYYDTSKGCPVGSYEWVDEWGNKVCKSF